MIEQVNQTYDELTKALDKYALLEKLKNSKKVNYFLLNIDNFANINDAYGYEIGDEVLIEVTKFIDILKPNTSTLYRFSSDKFVLIDERDLSIENVESIASSILSFFSHSDIVVNDCIELELSLTIGISMIAGSLNISQAEIALKEVRQTQRNTFKIFNSSSTFVKNRQQNIYWIHKIKEAVVNEEIIAYYQPIFNNKLGVIEKYECLARLKDDNEIISPYLFMEAAKVTSSLSYITKFIIAQSFQKFSKNDLEFSINITSDDLHQGYLEPLLLKNANKYKVNPSRVVLELLEDIVSINSNILSQLNSLRDNGFKIAIDDFGAQNSNFSRLLEIKPDYLKIDGAFIKNIIEDKNSQLIVEAIVFICEKSDIKVIAEFVHNKSVQCMIKDLGIEYSQGYYFGEPSLELL